MNNSATPAARTSNRESRFWIEYGAALWALIFAVLHVFWAIGWYVGLDAESARKAFAHRWFLAYDLVAAGLCLFAAAVALALVQPWGRRLLPLLRSVFAWSCAGILVVRGGAGVTQFAFLAATGKNVSSILSFWDVWFCLGAGLFAASAWRFWRTGGRVFDE